MVTTMKNNYLCYTSRENIFSSLNIIFQKYWNISCGGTFIYSPAPEQDAHTTCWPRNDEYGDKPHHWVSWIEKSKINYELQMLKLWKILSATNRIHFAVAEVEALLLVQWSSSNMEAEATLPDQLWLWKVKRTPTSKHMQNSDLVISKPLAWRVPCIYGPMTMSLVKGCLLIKFRKF